jgi:hypothetical protein
MVRPRYIYNIYNICLSVCAVAFILGLEMRKRHPLVEIYREDCGSPLLPSRRLQRLRRRRSEVEHEKLDREQVRDRHQPSLLRRLQVQRDQIHALRKDLEVKELKVEVLQWHLIKITECMNELKCILCDDWLKSVRTPCNHVFCRPCMKAWALEKRGRPNCPLCRRAFRERDLRSIDICFDKDADTDVGEPKDVRDMLSDLVESN